MAETYVVTGASRGLGLGLVERILEVAGTHAIAAARSPESSKGLQDLAQKYEGRLTLIKCDTTDESSVEVRLHLRSLSGAGLCSVLVVLWRHLTVPDTSTFVLDRLPPGKWRSYTLTGLIT